MHILRELLEASLNKRQEVEEVPYLPPFGIIEVIHAASIGVSANLWKGILSITTNKS